MAALSWRIVLVVIAIALAGANSCARVEQKSREAKLNQVVRLYADSIRWGNFDTAASLIRRRDGGSAAAAMIPADIRVTAYASGILAMNEERNEATVATSFDYYSPTTNKIRTISQTDLWWFDPATGQWFMDGSLPEFRP